MADSRSRMPPLAFLPGFGRVCFLVKFTRSTMALPLVARTRRTRPCLPASLPERTTTVSPFFTCGFGGSALNFDVAFPYMLALPLDDFRGQRDDLHELALTKLAGHRAEHTRAYRLARVIDQNGRVVVELDVGTVAAAGLFHGPDDDGLDHRALLDRAVRRGFLDRGGDDVAHPRVLAGRGAAQHLDAGDFLGAGVVGDLENRSHLDHDDFSMTSRTFHRFRLDSGRVSSITTRSPILMSGCSLCARNLLVRLMYF